MTRRYRLMHAHAVAGPQPAAALITVRAVLGMNRALTALLIDRVSRGQR
ncbi:hypothetical protein [Nocardia alni]|nr:hypothetical protein [Nocardia alni]